MRSYTRTSTMGAISTVLIFVPNVRGQVNIKATAVNNAGNHLQSGFVLILKLNHYLR